MPVIDRAARHESRSQQPQGIVSGFPEPMAPGLPARDWHLSVVVPNL
jgi:hypothetical protein